MGQMYDSGPKMFDGKDYDNENLLKTALRCTGMHYGGRMEEDFFKDRKESLLKIKTYF